MSHPILKKGQFPNVRKKINTQNISRIRLQHCAERNFKNNLTVVPFYSISVRQYKVSAKLKENAEMQDIRISV